MGPLYTVLLCLPAVVALIISVCGLAVVWHPPTGPNRPPRFTRAYRGAIAPWDLARTQPAG